MNNKGYKRKEERILSILLFCGILTAGILIKEPLLKGLGSISSEFSDKIIFTSLMLEKPKTTAEYLWQNYVRQDNEYDLKEEIHEEKAEPLESSSQNAEIEEIPLPQEVEKSDTSESSKKPKKTPPMIEPKYRGTILEQHFGGADNKCFVKKDGAFIRNYTNLTAEKILEILEKKTSLKIDDTDEPQVLIYHTHATESFEEYDSEYYDTRGSWRSTDNNKNMTAVGDELEKALKAKGIGVVHDYTHHDYPSYNGSYSRSAETIKSYLEKYPTIKVALDLHRDGIEKDGNIIVKSKAQINGEKASQVMVVCACDESYQVIPKWEENFRFGMDITCALEKNYKGLTRPLYLCNAKYNMDLLSGLLILEFGTNANTVEEAKITANAVGEVLGDLLKSYGEE